MYVKLFQNHTLESQGKNMPPKNSKTHEFHETGAKSIAEEQPERKENRKR